MSTIAVLRLATLLAWAVVLAATAGNSVRALRGVKRDGDELWTLCWFYALLTIGFGLKWLAGLTAPPQGAGVSATAGLLVLSIGIALATLYLRHQREGWRW